ncbi:hypothetical protein [Nocardia sp. NPDC051463]|uniref:hypothetical protein n=1 Tax=Nocardia sp. NPDC051463 TaxID=3154845 RepID=UPI00344B2045
MSRIVTHPDGWSFSAQDGNSWTAFEPEPYRGVRVTGWDGETREDWTATHGAMYTPDEIDEIADRLKAMADYTRGTR